MTMLSSMEREVSGCSSHASRDSPTKLSYDDVALLQFMEQLEMSNASQWIDVPMICVMGDTSSGKSSLLSNLAQVELPVFHTLTTKCPIRLQLKPSETKRATLSIQWKTDGVDKVAFGERIISEEEWDKIPALLVEAQEKVLKQTGLDVAPDVISFVVESPHCDRDLTVLDLPGIVRSKSVDESETMVRDVEKLLSEYLNNRRCILLAVVPANVDFHNSQIMADALKVDPTTSRTIPVITKPDLIDQGAEAEVVDLLLGKKMSFAPGFHMIKGRGQTALDNQQSIQEGLEDELSFFRDVEPWKSVGNRALFGTGNLLRKLADLQMDMIRQSLPDVLSEIRLKQQAAQSTLEEMGSILTTTSERRRYYQTMCQDLVSKLQSSLSGKTRSQEPSNLAPSAAVCLHDAVQEFARHIQDGALANINTVTEGAHVLVTSSRGFSVRGEVVHLDETFACVDFLDEEDAKSKVLFDCVGISTEEVVEENEVWSDGEKICIARKGNVVDTLKQIPLDDIRTDPSWLKEKIRKNRTDDLACFLPADIFRSIVADLVEEEWKPHCLALLDKTRQILLQTVESSISFTLRTNRYPELRKLVNARCQNAVKELVAPALKQVLSQIAVEKHPYTSLCDDLFQQISHLRHARLKRELEVSLRLDQEGVFDTQAIKAIVDGVFARSEEQSLNDHLAEELEHVLSSYGSVATKRILDRTPMISWELFRALATTIQVSLWSVTDEILNDRMIESAEFSSHYNQMVTQVDNMNNAIELFETFG